jgi:hypothetical protein
MKNIKITLLFLLTMGCIGTDIVDDAVPAKVVIQNPIVSRNNNVIFIFFITLIDITTKIKDQIS